MTIRFDDIDAINAHASEEFGEWGDEVVVTQDMIDQFAELTGDHQWIHVDVERAKDGPFGGTIAHGFLTLSLLPGINPGLSVEFDGYTNVLNYGSDGARFLAPVPSGSTLHARTRLVEARQHKKGTIIVAEAAIHVKGNETPSLLYTMLFLYM